MAIYRISESKPDGIDIVKPTRFADRGIDERHGLQRRLKECIGVLFPDADGKPQDKAAMVVAEEFSDFDDSKRRIDLLALDRSGNLVVIELKRTEDGNHMELQALRYAAMVSNMTFSSLIGTYARYAHIDPATAEAKLREFLGEEFEIETFNTKTHIVLASADFSKELMTTVLWLNSAYAMGIRCVRMKPYEDGEDTTLLDIHTLVPLPEAEQYLVKTREKADEVSIAKAGKQDRYTVSFEGGDVVTDLRGKRGAILCIVKGIVSRNHPPAEIAETLQGIKSGIFREFEGLRDADTLRDLLWSESGEHVPEGSKLDKRYFLGEGDVLHHDDRSYVLTNQWGARFEAVVEALCARYPFVTVTKADGNA